MMITKAVWVVAFMAAVARVCSGFEEDDDGVCRGGTYKDQVTALTLDSGIGQADISWEFPFDVCVYRFLVEATPLDANGGARGDSEYFRTPSGVERSFELPSDVLAAGTQYRIRVQVEYAEDFFGPEESIIGVPFIKCEANGTPGVPFNFWVTNQSWEGYAMVDGSMEVCWAPSQTSSAGCPDEYTLAIRVQPTSPSDLFNEMYDWRFETFDTAGCYRIKGIERGRMYDLGIRAYNAANMTSGDVAVIQRYATDRWECVEQNGYYELCPAARNQQCQPMTCDEIAANKLCDHPSVRKYDSEKFTAIQYCAESCGCSVPDKDEIRNVPNFQPDMDDRVCCRRD